MSPYIIHCISTNYSYVQSILYSSEHSTLIQTEHLLSIYFLHFNSRIIHHGDALSFSAIKDGPSLKKQNKTWARSWSIYSPSFPFFTFSSASDSKPSTENHNPLGYGFNGDDDHCDVLEKVDNLDCNNSKALIM